jgi:hypothetical protein
MTVAYNSASTATSLRGNKFYEDLLTADGVTLRVLSLLQIALLAVSHQLSATING